MGVSSIWSNNWRWDPLFGSATDKGPGAAVQREVVDSGSGGKAGSVCPPEPVSTVIVNITVDTYYGDTITDAVIVFLDYASQVAQLCPLLVYNCGPQRSGRRLRFKFCALFYWDSFIVRNSITL